MKYPLAWFVSAAALGAATPALAAERVITLGPGNTPPGYIKPIKNPPPPQNRGTCMVLPCGQKPVPFVPPKHR